MSRRKGSKGKGTIHTNNNGNAENRSNMLSPEDQLKFKKYSTQDLSKKFVLPSEVQKEIEENIILYIRKKYDYMDSFEALKQIIKGTIYDDNYITAFIKAYFNSFGLEIDGKSVVKKNPFVEAKEKNKRENKVVLYSFAKNKIISEDNAIEAYARWFQQPSEESDGNITFVTLSEGAKNFFQYVSGTSSKELSSTEELNESNVLIGNTVNILMESRNPESKVMRALGLDIKVVDREYFFVLEDEPIYNISKDKIKGNPLIPVYDKKNQLVTGYEEGESVWVPSNVVQGGQLPAKVLIEQGQPVSGTSNKFQPPFLPRRKYSNPPALQEWGYQYPQGNNTQLNIVNNYNYPEKPKRKLTYPMSAIALAVFLTLAGLAGKKLYSAYSSRQVAEEIAQTYTQDSEEEQNTPDSNSEQDNNQEGQTTQVLSRTTVPIKIAESGVVVPQGSLVWVNSSTGEATACIEGVPVTIINTDPDQIIPEGMITTKTVTTEEIQSDDGQTITVPEGTEVQTDGVLPDGNKNIHISFTLNGKRISGMYPYLSLEASSLKPGEREVDQYIESNVGFGILKEGARVYDANTGNTVNIPEKSIVGVSCNQSVLEDGNEYHSIYTTDSETNQIISGLVSSTDIKIGDDVVVEKDIPANLENAEWKKAEVLESTLVIYPDKELRQPFLTMNPNDTVILYTDVGEKRVVYVKTESGYKGWVDKKQIGLSPEEEKDDNEDTKDVAENSTTTNETDVAKDVIEDVTEDSTVNDGTKGATTTTGDSTVTSEEEVTTAVEGDSTVNDETESANGSVPQSGDESTNNTKQNETKRSSVNKANTDNSHIVVLNADKLDIEQIEKIMQQNIPANIESPTVQVGDKIKTGDMIFNWSSGEEKPNSVIIMCSPNSTNIADILNLMQENSIDTKIVVNLTGDYESDLKFIKGLEIKPYINLNVEEKEEKKERKKEITQLLEEDGLVLGIYTYRKPPINPIEILGSRKGSTSTFCIVEVQATGNGYTEDAKEYMAVLKEIGYETQACVVKIPGNNGFGYAKVAIKEEIEPAKPKEEPSEEEQSSAEEVKQPTAEEQTSSEETKESSVEDQAPEEEAEESSEEEQALEEEAEESSEEEQAPAEEAEESSEEEQAPAEEAEEPSEEKVEKPSTKFNSDGTMKEETDTKTTPAENLKPSFNSDGTTKNSKPLDLFIDKVKKENPELEITKFNPGISFSEAVDMEAGWAGKQPYKLLHPNSYNNNWLTDNTTTYQGGWRQVNKTAIAFFMDPRNGSPCQFLRIDVMPKNITVDDLKLVIKENGYSWLDGYEDVLYNTCKEKNLNVFFILARLINEQGQKGSATLYMKADDGKVYSNPGNIRATGSNTATIVNNACAYAIKQGWDSLDKGLEGAVDELLKQWVKKGQNTPYLIMYNINTESPAGGNASGQYAQAANAAQLAGEEMQRYFKITGKTLSGVLEIPDYNGLPESRSLSPDEIQEKGGDEIGG